MHSDIRVESFSNQHKSQMRVQLHNSSTHTHTFVDEMDWQKLRRWLKRRENNLPSSHDGVKCLGARRRYDTI